MKIASASTLAVAAALALAGCSSDLPEGWEDADSLSVVQGTCNAPHGNLLELVEAEGRPGELRVTYMNAPFRCEQKVTAYMKRDGALIDVLFQPEEMDPSSVARCDCAYTLESTFDAPEGGVTLTVYRRGDAYGTDTDPKDVAPVKVQTVVAEVPKS